MAWCSTPLSCYFKIAVRSDKLQRICKGEPGCYLCGKTFWSLELFSQQAY